MWGAFNERTPLIAMTAKKKGGERTMNDIFGISLGSTQACIAGLDRYGRPEVIHNLIDSSRTLATAIFFENADNVVIGNSAKDMSETDGERVVQFSHRELGKANANKYTFDGKEYSVEEINALFLAHLKNMAEEQGCNVKSVIFAIPAHFGMDEKRASKHICDLAGLNVLRIISEPVAAAVSYLGRRVNEDKTILIFDLGGGSLDITILKVIANKDQLLTEDSIKVLAIGGNDMLGGKDWDDKLFDFIMQTCCDENGLVPDEIDIETRQIIRSRVETTKKKLSCAEIAKVRVRVNGAMTNITITREEFENLTADKVLWTMTHVEDVLQRAGNIDIDVVLLVGGASYMPMIRNAVENRFPGKIQVMDPDQAIARGAALYGGMLLDLPYDDFESELEEPRPQQITQKDTQAQESTGILNGEITLKKEPGNMMLDKTRKENVHTKKFLAMLLKYALEHFLGDLTSALIESLDFKSCTSDELFQITIILHRRMKSNFYFEGILKNNCISSVVATDVETGQKFEYSLTASSSEQLVAGQPRKLSVPLDVAYARKQMEYAALATDEFCDKLAQRILNSIPWEIFDSSEIAYILRGAHSFFQSNGAKEDYLKVIKWESKLELT